MIPPCGPAAGKSFFPSIERMQVAMCPVFVRRGKVLFMLKTPADFLDHLHSGSIQPTDCLLVQNSGETEWVPIHTIRQFQAETAIANECNATGFNGEPTDEKMLN
jgi:hypothetical protein